MAFVNPIRNYSEKKLIGYTREQLFEVVAAVENYHLFVPACRKSEVVQRSRDRIKAKLEIGLPPLLEAYTSNVKLEKPKLILATCTEGVLFKHLETRWKFNLPPRPCSPDKNNTTRMEATVCKSVDTSTTDTIIEKSAELVTTNDNNGQIVAANLLADEKKPPLEEQSSLKIKRCRHGRIIVKDLSKKKIVQQDDRETNQLQSKSTVESKEETHQSISTQEGIELTTAEQNCEVITQSINSTAAPVIAKSTDVINQSSSPVDLEKTLNIKLDKSHERKEKSPDEIISSKKVRSKSPDRRRSRSRSRTSYRKKVSNRSPSHRKSPRRDRDKSPRRRDRSRSLRSGKSSSRRLSSSRRRRSPRGESRSPPVRHRDRQSSRNRSPRRRRSHSRSSGRNTGHSCRNTSRSPRRETDDRERSSKIERATRRRDIYDINASDLNNQLITEVSKAVNLDKSNSSQLMNSETLLSNQPLKPQESSENTSSQNHNHKELQSNQPSELNNTHKSSQQEVSPSKPMSAHSSLSPSTNNSASSDIYDPEGPIIPISPGDSPPSLSSMNKAANNKIEYLVENERNDDDVPSSAVQLNHQEKYLQKLNRQERVVEEVKLALKPHYQRRAISKEQYKDVLRRAVPKICHSKNGEINPIKIRALIDAYVKKMKRHSL